MDKRLILPIIIMFASVLLLSGLINFQAGQAQEDPDAGDVFPIVDDPTVVTQKADTSPAKQTTATSNNSSLVAPAPAPTATYYGGGVFSSSSVDDDEKKTTVAETEEKTTVIVVADFSYETDCLTANFTDLSENATSWDWDFGDGTVSELQNPEHTYTANGSYTVSLVAYADDTSNNASTEKLVIVECSEEEETEGPTKEEPTKEYPEEIPEFPTVAIPMVAIIGMAFFFSRKQ
ncbi:PKD domain-containing protein [Methanolobus profundi]|uniref:PEF-CTERM protein sorting domain-containing protein n=1 Tax=Methanolobus profundi TaxID=487685 RepID=A0A1I4NLQ7_9EURY|nr:PKD domain-containing protein [Methanolobus profundi]SFM16093.1 PEF-CTERM protein sorting domain-containing protein [Methanolobus profundi]